MKSVKKIFIVALAMVIMFSFSGCSNASFVGQGTIDSLVRQYGETQQMVMTVEYKTENDDVIRIEVTYDLLLKHVPITVVNFINLVESGYYNEKVEGDTTTSIIFHNRINGASTNAWVAGMYARSVGENDAVTYKFAPDVGYSILGEFYQNDWNPYPLTTQQIADIEANDEDPEDHDNNPDFKLFSLAMYYGTASHDFDTASTAFFLTTSSNYTENHRNYAVFAHFASMNVKKQNSEGTFETIASNLTAVDASVVYDFNNLLTTTESKTVVEIDEDGSTIDETTVSMFKYLIKIVSIEMVGSTDYSGLPKDLIIKD